MNKLQTMYKIIVVIALMISANTSAQEKIYLDKYGKVVEIETATRYKILSKETDKTIESFYKIGDTLVSRKEFSDYENGIRDGKTEYFSPEGWVNSRSHYKSNLLEGELIRFWTATTVRRIEHYSEDKMIDGKCFDEAGNEIPYFPGEVKPEYPGGNQKLYSDVANNFKVKGNGQGKIIVQFVVEKDGSVTEVAVKQGINPKLDKEAVRVIKNLPNFTPGFQEGKPVSVMYSLPINISR